MFTGIIREVGKVVSLDRSAAGARVRIEAPRSSPSLVPGGSIAVDGVCLTVTRLEGAVLTADAVPETLDATRLGDMRTGSRVNLELPLRIGDPLDGHIVQGHVDGIGTVAKWVERGTQREMTVRVDRALAPYLARKGSVAVNGVSLTITAATEDTFAVALIPTTLAETNLAEATVGTSVNLEVDVLARYVARWTESGRGASGNPPAAEAGSLTRRKLEEMGY